MPRFFNRLYVKVYLTIVATLILVVTVSAFVWRSGPEMDAAHAAFEMASGVATAALGFWVTAIWAARNVRATDQPSLAP